MWVEVILFVLLVLVLRHWLYRPKGLPPGPMVIPYLGNNAGLDIKVIKANWKKYGDIFKTEVGPTKFIYLCNYKLIKEAFNRAEFADRPVLDFNHFLSDGIPGGVVTTNGQQWQNARRFLLRNLRDLGMGKTYLEKAIQREAQSLVDDLKKRAGSPTPFPKSINVVALNVVWQMVASTRYELDDKKVLSVINIIRSFESSTLMFMFELFPSLKKITPKFIINRIRTYQILAKLQKEARSLTKELMASHRAKLDPNNPKDVIDEYLVAMDNNKDIAVYFSELDLMRIIFDLFTAAFETTSNMLRWTILYLIKNPEVQQQVQKQIDDVVPRDTLPSHDHKPRLPLVEALVHEALRMSSMNAVGVKRGPQTDVYVGGYLIPKGSFVYGCSVCCHEDSRYWDQPHEFKLERFLDDEGKFVSQKEGFLPFGIGRRTCLGESLARMELYLFTAALVQNFTFSVPKGYKVDIEEDTKNPSARLPKDQTILISTRA